LTRRKVLGRNCPDTQNEENLGIGKKMWREVFRDRKSIAKRKNDDYKKLGGGQESVEACLGKKGWVFITRAPMNESWAKKKEGGKPKRGVNHVNTYLNFRGYNGIPL